ncbi:DNA polymerase III subunit delta' [Corynebacterium bovis]|uniref:DNA polymerase-3 subunit delta n=1 Tax=Corynebacterium bovis DSM 20582 = CIP 54.80 TaxID=927655 RepID=A0A8I0CNM2_9CORY|nr:DNA polymerase III subunit delta' [Corynebacterium bovis]MBB3116908.1 DNA polymerase-3 subunit delta' [Corynebacterium bovis DSM 20582 = CIP 54.80]RRO83451.1 DNA polymerase III subunit delta' [Corynebacterium bovis]RRO90386.1 DNA polymerase III subunit delta' [Corynebacterium bovis]RRQ13361.1 DNA polymerase III subunit delta' [Corynebacterium bovis]WJY76809.1 DNA polymerase III subunit tau [Corynebacterium bovis DSM 20582 = CIP 54.80]
MTERQDIFGAWSVNAAVAEPLAAAARTAREMVAAGDAAGGRPGATDAAVRGAGAGDGTGPGAGTGTADAAGSGVMTHSWLLTGPPGSGRSVAAKAFATALVCDDPDVVGCGRCDQCRSVRAGTHPDVEWVSTEGMTITVDDVRAVIRSAAKMPTVARWRVVVVEDADRLGDGAANALLKSVEEPPARTVFVLCAPSTDPHDIAVTLRSRCRHLYVPTPSPAEVEQALLADTALGLTAEQAAWAAGVSGGHIGRARHLARDAVAREKRATALTLPKLVYEPARLFMFTRSLVAKAGEEAAASVEETERREREALESSLGVGSKGKGAAKAQRGASGQLKELEKEQKNRRTRLLRDSLDLALIDVAGLYRDAMLIAAGAVEAAPGDDGDGHGVPVGGLMHPDMAATSRELARRNSPEALVRCIDAVAACREALGFNVKPEVALDAMAGRLRECCRLV